MGKEKKFKLREYQDNDSNRIIELLDDYDSILYQLPTGGGKTVIIQTLVDKIVQGIIKTKNKKSLILVHRREIIFQIRDRLKSQGITAGILISNHEENIESDILIGSILTVARDTRLEGILNRNFDFGFIDEAHHACSNSYLKTIIQLKEHNPKFKLVGFTATPHRMDGKPLSQVFDILLLGPSIPELQKLGHLCKSTTYAIDLEKLEGITKSGGDYKTSELSKFMRDEKIIQYAIDSYISQGNNKQMLVYCVDKTHAKQIQIAYDLAGFKTALIDSDTPTIKRDKAMVDYRSGVLDIIISIQTLTEGLDLPETGVVQLLRPTLSLVLYMQMVGRGLRPKADKSDLVILDIANCSREHGLVDSDRNWNLKDEDPNQQQKKNKIVGVREDGTIEEDIKKIEAGNLELIELSPEEYFMRKQGGLIEAEQRNKDVHNELYDAFVEFLKELNEQIDIKDAVFLPYNERERMVKYTDDFDHTTLKMYGNDICKLTLKNDSDKGKYLALKSTFHTWGYNKGDDDAQMQSYITTGKIAELISKTTKSNKIIKSWVKVLNVKEKIFYLQKIKQQIKDFEEKQLLQNLNIQFSKGNHTIKLLESQRAYNYFRDINGAFDEIVFDDAPKRPRGNNRVTIYETTKDYGRRYKGTVSSLKKEDIIKILQKDLKVKSSKGTPVLKYNSYI